ncbi:DUF92 domain-containing protein [Saccharibacillus sp. CPCC 101409]|uniref:DUF92 domain-containing protein n=1 Tax=Saccharibacillus sp. CPCC 101409 TaxID=3058041 RepID=UPI002670F7B2|nr:DUF92 domain-containing protein [Saccharibacillus sp. CPCC 101409]MDO3408975.1 DUF92 domain-containing protein [Saccharibacillus sp. CPCC 101409]
MDWIIGAIGACLVAGAAYAKRSLSGSGAIAAIVMGTIYYGAGDLFWFGLLLLFFVTSSVLSRVKQAEKRQAEQMYEKSGRRDAMQVFANGGIGMALCLCNYWLPSPVWFGLFVGVMATVTADTWATEWGSLSRKPPRSVVTWKPLPAGTSGGVSLRGTAASAVGAGMIGAAAAVLLGWTGTGPDIPLWQWIPAGLVGGTLGALTDSYLGATVQVMYRCPSCGKLVETRQHCGTPTVRERGLSVMNNDAVNLMSSVCGGALALGMLTLAGRWFG